MTSSPTYHNLVPKFYEVFYSYTFLLDNVLKKYLVPGINASGSRRRFQVRYVLEIAPKAELASAFGGNLRFPPNGDSNKYRNCVISHPLHPK